MIKKDPIIYKISAPEFFEFNEEARVKTFKELRKMEIYRKKMDPFIYKKDFYYFEDKKIKKVKLIICDASHILKYTKGIKKLDTFIIDPKHDDRAAMKIIDDITKKLRFQVKGKLHKNINLKTKAKINIDYYNYPEFTWLDDLVNLYSNKMRIYHELDSILYYKRNRLGSDIFKFLEEINRSRMSFEEIEKNYMILQNEITDCSIMIRDEKYEKFDKDFNQEAFQTLHKFLDRCKSNSL